MTTTVTTTTVTTANAIGFAGTFELLLTLALVALLIVKEIVAGSTVAVHPRWNLVLWVGLAPLLFSFTLIVAVNMAEVFA